MTVFLIVIVVYIIYSIYMDNRKKRVIGDLTKAVNQAQAIADENNRNFNRILERLDEINPDVLERDYYFQKEVSGRSRMFTAPVRYSQERQVFVISATDALNYERQLALAYPSNTLHSALAALTYVDKKNTDLPVIVNDTTFRRFPYGETEST